MRNELNFLIAAALMAGVVSAQQASESVEGVFKELAAYTDAEAPAAQAPAVEADVVPDPVEEPVPAAVAEPVVEAEPEAAMADEPEAVVADSPEDADMQAEMEADLEVGTEADVEALVETSREQFVGGEFAKAQEGFKEAVKLKPDHLIARMYLRMLQERDHRKAEVKGMKAVDAAWSTDMVLRSYALADGAGESMDLGDTTGSVNASALFPQVDFPKGSSAVFQSDMNILFVRNTAQNLAVLEAILDAMEVLKDSSGGDQVEIEAKFVEVSEGTLEQLGFQWNFTSPVGIGGGSDTVVHGDGFAPANINSGFDLFGDSLRGSSTVPFSTAGAPDGAATGDWSTFRMTDAFSTAPSSVTLKHSGTTPLDVMISALDQSSGADLLSAPRVVTRSGEEATIRVGELHYYPEVYEGTTGQGVMLTVAYQDFSEKLLGVELTVTPEVDGQNKNITLELNPRITELAGWQSYQLAPSNYVHNYRQDKIPNEYQHQAVVARLPVFKKREIQTQVTIADGSTIGMGGLISEKNEAYEDKVPLLGSLPLVGRFFRNEGERAVKRNLLMFVTAKIVEPTGRINTSRSFE